MVRESTVKLSKVWRASPPWSWFEGVGDLGELPVAGLGPLQRGQEAIGGGIASAVIEALGLKGSWREPEV